MKLQFWLCLIQVAYTYFGYPLWLALCARMRPVPIIRAFNTPKVSIIIAARNEEKNIARKLRNLFELEYPKDRIQIIVVSDGSTDATASILREHAQFIVPIILSDSRGKANALNKAVESATGEVLVFQDARQMIEPNAISELIACFADPTVGAVSGELLLDGGTKTSKSAALGIYWRLEKAIRKMESDSGSVIGVTGALYAIRKELFTPMPIETILDDVFVPMYICRAGKRVIFQPTSIAHDQIFTESGKEFSRKVRTLTGNYQLLKLAPWLLSPKNPLLFRFISHKLLRLLVPLSLFLMLVSTAFAGGTLYKGLFVLQVVFYGLAALGRLSPPTKRMKLVSFANTFVMLNIAAAMAFYNFVSRRERVWS